MDNISKELDYFIDEVDLSFLKNRSILLTGASGLIGSYFVHSIMHANKKLKTNIKIYSVVRNYNRAKIIFDSYIGNKNFELIIHDINEEFKFDFKVDYIVHAASNANPKAFEKDPIGTIKSNLYGTFNLLDFAKLNNAKFLYLSSSEVYGEPTYKNQVFTENDVGLVNQLLPRSCYTESKRMAENICVNYSQQFKVFTLISRIGFAYGHSYTDYDNRVVPQFMRKALNNENIVMKSNGSLIRSYIYIFDVISGLVKILEKGESSETYNVANNFSNTSIREIASTVANVGNVNITYDLPKEEIEKGYAPFSTGLIDGTKLEKLGWKPLFSLEKGIENSFLILKEKNVMS